MAARLSNYSNLILVRHGQSTYNLENRFTGWKDVPLTNNGINEAHEAGKILKKYDITNAFASKLIRAQKTLEIILSYNNTNINVVYNEALNERDYGDLIGQNKQEAAKLHGKEQVQIWRRSYDIAPPNGESLKMTYDRTVPFFNSDILSILNKPNRNILISAHGNSIRAIIMYLFKYDTKEILLTEIGWCEPWIIKLNSKNNIIDFTIKCTSKNSNSKYPRKPN